MMEIPDDRQIYISGRVWHELYPKVNVSPFIYALHLGIDLSKYGDGLQKFYFTYLVLQPDNKLFGPGTYFSKKKRSAEVAVAIDYNTVLEATDSEVLKLMETAYLEGIDLIRTIKLPAPFDIDAFKADVEAIFAQDNWQEQVMKAA